jgi:hypothetical protein
MYAPETIRSSNVSTAELVEYLQRELEAISVALQLVQEGRFLPVVYVAPDKPREGMLVVADGTSWNPGSGKGIYEYRRGAWAKL